MEPRKIAWAIVENQIIIGGIKRSKKERRWTRRRKQILAKGKGVGFEVDVNGEMRKWGRVD